MSAPRLSEFIKAYDVRGLVPQQLNDAVAFAIGSAFAQVVALPDGATSIVIGHDMRPSSPGFSMAPVVLLPPVLKSVTTIVPSGNRSVRSIFPYSERFGNSGSRYEIDRSVLVSFAK